MESSKKKSGGVEISKKNRSLDLKSLYESKFSEVRGSKKKVCDENDGESVKKKKRKSRKEIPLSSFESDAKKSRKEDVNGVKQELEFEQKSKDRSEGLHDIPLPLGNNGSSFNIPKRPRGSVRRKKLGSDQGSEPTRHSDSAGSAGEVKAEVTKSEDGEGPNDRLARVATTSSGNNCLSSVKSKRKVNGSNSKLKQKSDSKPTVKSSGSNVKLKQKTGAEEVKDNRNGESGSACHAEKEHNPVVNNKVAPPKRQQNNSRKKKDAVLSRGRGGVEAKAKKSQPSMGSSSDRLFVDFVDDDDDDEENLEQNAARMLSSRFDPSCTGFSSKKSSASQKADGLLFSSSSAQDSFTRRAKSFAGPSASADDKSRTLRPRRENAGKGVSRKRRHFYEILAQDLDPYWVLNRRIKIFWPLDESWYYGLVNDYNSETKHHRIKYDDREEEIVNLLDEKFKLLLLPSEVPDNSKTRKRRRVKDLRSGQIAPSAGDDICVGDPLDSEPIASWLASQSQRAKASPKSLKRQRTSEKHLPLVSSLSSEKTDNSNSGVVDSTIFRNNRDCESASVDSLLDGRLGNNSLPGSAHTSLSEKHVVYVRKKYRKTSEGGNSVSRDVKACRTSPWTVPPLSPVRVGLRPTKGRSGKILWSLDGQGKLRLKDVLLEPEQFKFQICLPILPAMGTSFEIGNFTLLHDIFMLQHGVLVASSPAVVLEMLFIDTNFGMRFLLYEGCLKQAVALIFQILIVFSQFDEKWNDDMKLPATSIRFQLSSSQDPRKQHVFAFYSFSKLKSSRWLYLDSEILKHCFLIKQLPISECTYDNIKELECGNFQSRRPCDGSKHSSNEGFKKKYVSGILPMGVSREARNKRMTQSAFSLAAKPGKVPQFALSFSAAPTFFLTLHLQLLMEHSFAWVNLQHHDALCSSESSDDICQPGADCARFKPRFSASQDGTTGNEIRKIAAEAPGLNGFQRDSGMEVVLASNAAENDTSSKKIQRGNPENDGRDGCLKEIAGNASKIISQPCQQEPRKEAHQLIDAPRLSSMPTSITSQTADPRIDSTSRGMRIEIPSSESRQASDVDWNVHDGFVHKPNTIGFRSSWQHGGNNSVSSPFGHKPPVWPDGSPNFTPNGFSNGPKKPRTQVQYTLPFVGCDLSEKQKSPSTKSLPCKRIRKASLKRISDGSGNNRKNLESLSCVANVLVTNGDKGWRECGAHIVLEVDDHNEWRLAVKLSGVTKYSYKVKHILQPGSTNRFSHAMMWKGGKDWVLEFPDRSQWMLFKEMHEECHDRNIRAASVKNIPIPGVRLVEESDDHGNEAPFVRNPIKYFRQVQNDVEMAMDPSHVLYDMDSDDEQWLMSHNSRADKHDEISEESLEKAIDMFEKVSYSQHRLNFTDDEIEKLLSGMGSTAAAKVVHQYWREKREKIGMSLIRHLQPPLWERYQQQLKEWEHKVSPGLYAFSAGNQGKVPPEKPPMFAFCLRPRGLEVPNKGSKQRSHRRLPVSGHHHASLADHDGLVFGRRSNGHVYGDEKAYASSLHHDSSDVSPSLRGATRVLSPRDAHFYLSTGASDWKGSPKFYKNKSKKLGSYPSYNNQQTMIPYTPRSTGKRNAIQQWNTGGVPESPGQRSYFLEGPDSSADIHEFRLRDACGAAQHAQKMAKLKREKAQKLFYRADLAVHKAVLALMNAEAIKEPLGDSIDIN
ncbi:uncharacterized protein LOC131015202 [Salvia miltiorrhiza]|uniref:uncharacterized protein LOC131015202 n=1 Tax=Salvia miltiorrhiza TaxID=226208 RepID=UPI0025AB9C62|nr:uncharacterized protein LOC131015202 [Salvia miltiorrhiza]XP_057799462.1 uncharacterized protein LOC131015202 [Salvia miltiorrhiza]